ncbi:MAG: phosphoglucosamine mutase [Chitinophagales bacterium]|nr:phosphoglucosamine mutase [Chitinophagales bacterium]
MTLIKSISGIRGTIGGAPGTNLTPVDVLKFTLAFGTWVKSDSGKNKIVIGRDARVSGQMVSNIVVGALQSIGIDVLDLGLSTTPTVEFAVANEKAGGGIIITASHNPKQWNALKLLNSKGEFISAAAGEQILKAADNVFTDFKEVNALGSYATALDYIDKHIEHILKLKLVDTDAIKARKFRIAIDCVNSTGGIAVPKLLRALGVEEVIELYTEPNGLFPHNPEPLPEHLHELASTVKKKKADLGISVDPDVDRLALVCEDGNMFGEEYTLVAVADYVLSSLPAGKAGKKGITVSNLSSTRALRDVTEKRGGIYHAAAVGEVNVVEKMKEVKAVIGGEGNGGVIYPESHYGRDALVGIALFLSHLAKFGKSASLLRASYPNYHISKKKIDLDASVNMDNLFEQIQKKYKKYPINTIDGVKIEFDKDWVHLRRSNTEPIIRIYAESNSETTADNIAEQIMADLREFSKG